MKLSDLLAGYDHHVLQGDPELADVKAGVAYDSRRMTPGSMYIALQGARTDGHRFVRDAVERGAVAVLIDRPIDDGLPPNDPHHSGVGGSTPRPAAHARPGRGHGDLPCQVSVLNFSQLSR